MTASRAANRLAMSSMLGLAVLLGGCATDMAVPGSEEEQLPLMRTLPLRAFPQHLEVEVHGGEGWSPTGVYLPAGTPVRVWVDAPARGDVGRIGGPLAPLMAPGALLLRVGDRVFDAGGGLAFYTSADGALELGLNGGGVLSDAKVTLAWGTPSSPHDPGLDLVATLDPVADPWSVDLDGVGQFVEVGTFEPGARFLVDARAGDANGATGADDDPEAWADPGPMARLLPAEAAEMDTAFPGLSRGGFAYRVDGELVGELPVGGVLHLPDGGRLEVARNGSMSSSAAPSGSWSIDFDPLPAFGVERSTLPWGAFSDARTTVVASSLAAWTSTEIEVDRGDVIRVAAAGWMRDVHVGDYEGDVSAGGLLVRAPTEAGWLVEGSRVLAPHVRIGEHVMAVPADGVLVAPIDGLLQVSPNGCEPGVAGACAESMEDASGQFEFAVGVARVFDVP